MNAAITKTEIIFPCPYCACEIRWGVNDKPSGMLTRASRLKHFGRDQGTCQHCSKLVVLQREAKGQ